MTGQGHCLQVCGEAPETETPTFAGLARPRRGHPRVTTSYVGRDVLCGSVFSKVKDRASGQPLWCGPSLDPPPEICPLDWDRSLYFTQQTSQFRVALWVRHARSERNRDGFWHAEPVVRSPEEWRGSLRGH